ncbi:MAG: rod shape-determining protein [Patescibacteria group bacterium]|nr:rod shape-determining protein [Patescibacteria group bacterium]
MYAKRLAIDLGTTNTRIAVPGRGIVVDEPSVVAVSADTNKILAVGKDAEEMLGKTPDSIVAVNPIKDGAIASYKVTEGMLRYFFDHIAGIFSFVRPEVIIAVPAGITSTERRAVVDAAVSAGAKQAYIIKSPVAAALGAGIPIGTPSGHMIIDIGGGTTEVAVISLGDIVVSESARIGGEEIDQAIINYVRKKYKLIIGLKTAQKIKHKIGSVVTQSKEKTLEVSGSNSVNNLPETLYVSNNDVAQAVGNVMSDIISSVKLVLQKTPPELAADVIDKGMVMTGGGSLLRGSDQFLAKITGIPCQVADDAPNCVVKGAEIALERLDDFKEKVLWLK